MCKIFYLQLYGKEEENHWKSKHLITPSRKWFAMYIYVYIFFHFLRWQLNNNNKKKKKTDEGKVISLTQLYNESTTLCLVFIDTLSSRPGIIEGLQESSLLPGMKTLNGGTKRTCLHLDFYSSPILFLRRVALPCIGGLWALPHPTHEGMWTRLDRSGDPGVGEILLNV